MYNTQMNSPLYTIVKIYHENIEFWHSVSNLCYVLAKWLNKGYMRGFDVPRKSYHLDKKIKSACFSKLLK